MRNKCVRCGNDASQWEVVCYDCREKESRLEFMVVCAIILLFFAVVVGVRIGWAVYAFDDWRCALSECRIIKE